MLKTLAELQGVLNGLDEGITVQDATGELVFANDAAALMLGYASRTELLRAGVQEVAKRFELVGDAAAKDLPGRRVLQGDRTAEAIVEFRLAPSRRLHTASIRSHELIGANGTRYVVNHFHDITEKQRRDEQVRFLSQASDLLSSSLDFENVLKQIPALVVPQLADWCAVEIINEKGAAIEQIAVAHTDPEKLASARRLREAYPLQWDKPEMLPRALREGVSELLPEIPFEYQLAGVTNPEHIALIQALNLRSAIIVPLKARGAILGMITFVVSDTERLYDEDDLRFSEELAAKAAAAIDNARMYRKALQAISTRDEFLSVASHELRTPLTSLALRKDALVRALRAQPVDPERIFKQVEPFERQLQRLSELVDALLDVSRLAQGGIRIERKEADLAAIVREVLSRFESQLGQAKASVSVSLESAVGHWDPLRLEQLATNLISNAIKYGNSSEIAVTVRAGAQHAELIVADRGRGIHPEELARIFERFERATANSDTTPGLGLGLYIARQIVRAHGGDIRVESRPGEGATFVVTLPYGS